MNDLSSQEINKPIKLFSPAEVKERGLRGFAKVFGLEGILERLGNKVLPKFLHGNEQEVFLAEENLKVDGMKAIMAMGLETHAPLMETVDEMYQALIKEVCDQFIQDNNCTTAHEKATAELAANAYARVIDNSKRLNESLIWVDSGQTSINHTRYLSFLSRQIDRANRQYITALLTLRQLKTPPVEVRIKATTAFIAQNQQVNLNKQSHEINESK